MRFIDDEMVKSVLRMDALIPVMREAMIDFSSGRITQPARRILPVEKYAGFFASMPAVSETAVGAKLLSFYPGNADMNLPTHMAVIMLFKAETGEPIALIDGHCITEMRTAAVSAVFIDAVADKDVNSLAIIGAGVQARSHLEAMAAVRKFSDIRISNRNRERAEQLAGTVGAKVMDCEEAVRGADVVVAATASAEPVFRGEWLKQDAKVVSVGWAGAEGCELDAVTVAHTLIVDSREGAQTESGNVLCHQASIHAELGEVLLGDRQVDKASIVVFDSIGMACQDLAAAAHVMEKLEA